MKDKTIPDPKNRKKFMFYDTPDRQARLKIRCKYDGINQSQFFRYMITGYLEMDSSIIKYLDHCKEKYGGQGIQKRKKITKMHSKTEFEIKKFSLDEGEIENIFDIIEADTTI